MGLFYTKPPHARPEFFKFLFSVFYENYLTDFSTLVNEYFYRRYKEGESMEFIKDIIRKKILLRSHINSKAKTKAHFLHIDCWIERFIRRNKKFKTKQDLLDAPNRNIVVDTKIILIVFSILLIILGIFWYFIDKIVLIIVVKEKRLAFLLSLQFSNLNLQKLIENSYYGLKCDIIKY